MFKISYEQSRDALTLLYNRWGMDYVFGAEVAPGELPNAHAIDCSELTERVFNDILGVKLPDGSYNQFDFCRSYGRLINYPAEKAQPLDLVFLHKADSSITDHVAIVFGEVMPVGGVLLIEARGRPFGKVMFSGLDKFIATFGQRFAGVWRLVEPQN